MLSFKNMLRTIVMIILSGSLLLSCSGSTQQNLGVKDSSLMPCPESPNCVSTQDPKSSHAVAPFTYNTTAGNTLATMKEIVGSMKGATVVSESHTYLHVEFRSDIFRFIDDVEFFVDGAKNIIHVRSASRIGYYDFGINRRRVERIRHAWEQRKARKAFAE
jgi:uncharacterized protein (DUF1499 family)